MVLYRLLGLALMCLMTMNSFAQELKFESFQRLDRDLLARTQERLDLNEDPCAVVRVSVSNAKAYSFEGNIIGEVNYRPGEAIIYMTKGTRNLTIKSDKFGTMKYDFPERLEKQVVYKLTLKLVLPQANKIRTMVMPVVGIGSSMESGAKNFLSYGLMVAVVRKWGGYIKAKYDFNPYEVDGECYDHGMVNGEKTWFTGDRKSSRLAITGGVMYRVTQPFYLYAGAGYGYKKWAWETIDVENGNANSLWYENADKTSVGAEAEIGCVLRLKSFALSVGCQTNSFKYYEATVGVGVMF